MTVFDGCSGGIKSNCAAKQATIINQYRRDKDDENAAHFLPPPPAKGISVNQAIEDMVRQTGKRYVAEMSVFGLEHSLHYFVERLPSNIVSYKTILRLSPEPIIIRFWQELKTLDFKDRSVQFIASMLMGRPAEFRRGEIWADDDNGNRVYFERLEQSKAWLDDLFKIRAFGHDPLNEAIFFYARTIIAHPFRDGNGRFARSLMYGSLAKAGLISTPCLALGYAFDIHKWQLARAITDLNTSGDWGLYAHRVSQVIGWSCKHISQLPRFR